VAKNILNLCEERGKAPKKSLKRTRKRKEKSHSSIVTKSQKTESFRLWFEKFNKL
jgi:hypothetical protein